MRLWAPLKQQPSSHTHYRGKKTHLFLLFPLISRTLARPCQYIHSHLHTSLPASLILATGTLANRMATVFLSSCSTCLSWCSACYIFNQGVKILAFRAVLGWKENKSCEVHFFKFFLIVGNKPVITQILFCNNHTCIFKGEQKQYESIGNQTTTTQVSVQWWHAVILHLNCCWGLRMKLKGNRPHQ